MARWGGASRRQGAEKKSRDAIASWALAAARARAGLVLWARNKPLLEVRDRDDAVWRADCSRGGRGGGGG